MTCPTCSRSNRDFVNSSGLLTRCDDAWHIGRDFLAETLATTPLPRHWLAEAASPARPDDFATQAAPDSPKPTPSHHGAAKTVADASIRSPFDPNPPKLEPAQNGFRWCNLCDSVAEAKGHECAPPPLTHDDCSMCHFPVIHDGHGWVCSGCAPEEDRRRVIRRAARGGGR